MERPEGDRAWTLAYKLAGCVKVPADQIDELPMSELGRYAVIATDPIGTAHYSLSGTVARDFSEHFLRLRFIDKKPIATRARIGWWLRGFPTPDEESVKLLTWMDRKIRYGRRVLMSYAREDRDLALWLSRALEERGLSVWRDTASLRAGQNWREAVRDNLRIADAFVVVLTVSSLDSTPVAEEIGWALESLADGDGVAGVFTVLGPDMDAQSVPWSKFDRTGATIRLRDLNAVELKPNAGPQLLDRLALDIGVQATREPREAAAR